MSDVLSAAREALRDLEDAMIEGDDRKEEVRGMISLLEGWGSISEVPEPEPLPVVPVDPISYLRELASTYVWMGERTETQNDQLDRCLNELRARGVDVTDLEQRRDHPQSSPRIERLRAIARNMESES